MRPSEASWQKLMEYSQRLGRNSQPLFLKDFLQTKIKNTNEQQQEQT